MGLLTARRAKPLRGDAGEYLAGPQSLTPEREGVAGERHGVCARERMRACCAARHVNLLSLPGDAPAGGAGGAPLFARPALAAGTPVVGNPAVVGSADGPFFLRVASAQAAPENAHEALLGDPADELVCLQMETRAAEPPRPGVQRHPIHRRSSMV